MNIYSLLKKPHSAGKPDNPPPSPPETSEDVIKSGNGK
jgi:hypothetical protein